MKHVVARPQSINSPVCSSGGNCALLWPLEYERSWYENIWQEVRVQLAVTMMRMMSTKVALSKKDPVA